VELWRRRWRRCWYLVGDDGGVLQPDDDDKNNFERPLSNVPKDASNLVGDV
jgi:hypothetical protein